MNCAYASSSSSLGAYVRRTSFLAMATSLSVAARCLGARRARGGAPRGLEPPARPSPVAGPGDLPAPGDSPGAQDEGRQEHGGEHEVRGAGGRGDADEPVHLPAAEDLADGGDEVAADDGPCDARHAADDEHRDRQERDFEVEVARAERHEVVPVERPADTDDEAGERPGDRPLDRDADADGSGRALVLPGRAQAQPEAGLLEDERDRDEDEDPDDDVREPGRRRDAREAYDRRRDDDGEERREAGAGECSLERPELRREDPGLQEPRHRQEGEVLDLLRDREQRRGVGPDGHEGDVTEREHPRVPAEDLQPEHDDEEQEHLHRGARVDDVAEGLDEQPAQDDDDGERERRPDPPREAIETGQPLHAAASSATTGRRRRLQMRGRKRDRTATSPSGWKTRMAMTARNANSCVWLAGGVGGTAWRALMIAPRTNPPRAGA